jgi:heptosyltransferase III
LLEEKMSRKFEENGVFGTDPSFPERMKLNAPRNLCGQLSVRESAAMLSRSETYIGHDSGPMHLAAAVGTLYVAILSSRNLPGEWFPPGSQHRILYKTVGCMGCRRDVCEERNKTCIRSISVDEVFGRVMRVLSTGTPSRFQQAIGSLRT